MLLYFKIIKVIIKDILFIIKKKVIIYIYYLYIINKRQDIKNNNKNRFKIKYNKVNYIFVTLRKQKAIKNKVIFIIYYFLNIIYIITL